MLKIRRIHNYLYEISVLKYVLLIVGIGYILSSIFTNLVLLIFETNITKEMNFNLEMLFETIMFSIIISPLVETSIFQAMVLGILEDSKFSNYIKILISSLLFSTSHIIHSISYAISAFPVGIILAYSYILFKQKNQKPILVVALIHSLFNALALASQIFLN